MQKPKTKADLMPPFRVIGEASWAKKFLNILTDYGVEPAKGLSEEILKRHERELKFKLPDSLRIFLLEFGCIDLDDFCLYPLSEIAPIRDLWFRGFLSSEEQKQLPNLLGIADTGFDNVMAIDPTTGRCYVCSHDPAGIFLEADSFDDLLQKVIIDLSWGYYGWPDFYIETLASELKHDLFGD